MIRPELTGEAEADLDEAWDYIARNNPTAADRLIDAIVKTAHQLAQFPESGRARPEFGPDIRSFVVSPYVLFYRPIEGTIQVLRVLHGRRDIGRIMRIKKKR
jgi:toxin ParE1/3/4